MENPAIYMDHAATTPLAPEAAAAMAPFFARSYGNPSTLYSLGQDARRAIDEAREHCAQVLRARPSELVFTSGGTESDNAALIGPALALKDHGRHIVTTQIEHHAVLRAAELLESLGWTVSRVAPPHNGVVRPEDILDAVRPETTVVSVMLANNEIGTIQPIAEIARLVKQRAEAQRRPIIVHTDAVQAAGAIPIDVNSLAIDLLSLSAHKFHGPKGVGLLYIRRGTPFTPTQIGGEQERDRRAGTENTPGIIGMSVALQLAERNRQNHAAASARLRDRLLNGILERIDRVLLNGDYNARLPANLNVSIQGVDAEPLLMGLDLAGVAASSGSACAAGSLEPSHVLLALGRSNEMARSSLRLTVGPETADEDVDYVVETLARLVPKLRALSGN